MTFINLENHVGRERCSGYHVVARVRRTITRPKVSRGPISQRAHIMLSLVRGYEIKKIQKKIRKIHFSKLLILTHFKIHVTCEDNTRGTYLYAEEKNDRYTSHIEPSFGDNDDIVCDR